MTVVIDEDRTSQFLIKKSNETFRFLADNNFVVDSANGILERKGENRNKIDVQNYIEVQGEGFAAIHATGLKTKVSTGVGAVFSADMGILHQGDQGRVFFFGSMEAVTAGIRTTGRGASVVSDGSLGSDGIGIEMRGHGGTSQLTNSGYVEAALAVHIEGSAIIENTGTLIGAGVGVEIHTSAKQKSSLTNGGMITGGDDLIAIKTGAGRDVVVNTGTLAGKVLLGAGNDRFENFGEAQTAFGGKGNDIYILSQGMGIGELKGEGFDVVKSTVSTTAPSFVEKLILIGNDDIYGGGTSLDDWIVGNAGKNTLFGGGGRDKLTGRGGEDEFRFADDYDKDVVTDFKPNIDVIYIPNWSAIESYDDLIDNHLKIDGKDLIFRAGDDSLTLKNVKFNQIDADDFVI